MSTLLIRVTRYAFVGLVTLGVYLVAGREVAAIGAAPLVQASVPFVAAVLVNYVLQRGWVFEDTRPVAATLPRYALMVGIGYLVNLGAFRISPFAVMLWTQLFAAALVVISNAVQAFLWVFATRRPT